MPDFFTTAEGRKIAYEQTDGQGPGIVFLGGFKSDMQGSKATHLENWAKGQGRPFLRFDYSGHGQSSGAFIDGAIGDWAADGAQVINALTQGPQVLVGSSMGGWISLILAMKTKVRISAIVGIAAAPDFTEDSMWGSFSTRQKDELLTNGQVALPSEYGEPYVITRRLIEDGRDNLVLRNPLNLPFPVRLLQGSADVDVAMSVPLRIMEYAQCDDLRLTIVKGADHRFSTPKCLALIEATVSEVLEVCHPNGS